MPTDQELLARIDERTSYIKEKLDELGGHFDAHVIQDHKDFKTVHGRINKVEKKQAWILGVASGLGVLLGVVGAIIKDTLSGGNS